MRYLIRLLFIFPIFLTAHDVVIPLGELGSIRYVFTDSTLRCLLRVERLSHLDELMYVHSYNYDGDGRMIS